MGHWQRLQYFTCLRNTVAATIKVALNAVSRQHVQIVVDTQYSAKDPTSIPKLTLSDMKTKHGTRWNDECTLSVALLL